MEAFGYEINPPPWLSTADTNITFNGTGDAELCNKTMKTVFNFSTCNVSDTCINGQYFWPPVDHTSKEFKVSQIDNQLINLFPSNYLVYSLITAQLRIALCCG